MKPYRSLLFATLVLFLSACGSQDPLITSAAPISNSTSTPDTCSAENIAGSIKEVNDLQREFDDASQLASNLAREQLPNSISDMQRLRRAAEDHQVPACLSELKTHQLAHMNIVIDTMISFVGGADTETLDRGIAEAREEHDLYTLEIARLLGITLGPDTNLPISTLTPTP
jgi:hypothetical protein